MPSPNATKLRPVSELLENGFTKETLRHRGNPPQRRQGTKARKSAHRDEAVSKCFSVFGYVCGCASLLQCEDRAFANRLYGREEITAKAQRHTPLPWCVFHRSLCLGVFVVKQSSHLWSKAFWSSDSQVSGGRVFQSMREYFSRLRIWTSWRSMSS